VKIQVPKTTNADDVFERKSTGLRDSAVLRAKSSASNSGFKSGSGSGSIGAMGHF